MKPCIIIPCFNHAATVTAVAKAARKYCPVLVVDDGSTVPVKDLPGCAVIRLKRNSGKAAALRAGFQRATELGYTHALTMDADGQHFADDLPAFLELAQARPECLLVGVRDFFAAGCPPHRRRSNAVSTFWFRAETGVRLGDTQCGFRGYPLALTQRLQTRSGRYAFELEFMVRAAWVGTAIVPVAVRCTYAPGAAGPSHFRPVRDLAHITIMNIGLVLQSWFVPRPLRVAWSFGRKKSLRLTIAEIFSENAHEPGRLAGAVGLGLFFGIAPLWGFQLISTVALAHVLRLNKAIAVLASNISLPPMIPLILYAALALGHWLFTGENLGFGFSPASMTRARVLEYFWQWLAGSVLLAALVAALGGSLTYGVARLVQKK